ncbi:hypothetical protein Tco_0966834 [Tanacetum coccineum]
MNTRLNIEKLNGNIVQKHRGDHEAEVFQVSNDDTAVAQRRLEDKQPEEKTNMDCLRSTQQCTLFSDSGLSKVLWAEDTTMSTYLVTRSPSSSIRFKTPIDMLGFFGWLASIKQGMLEPVKVKCIFLGYSKGSMQVLQGDEFEVEPHDGHTFEGATLSMGTIQYREDINEAAFVVAAVEKIYAHESLTFNNIVAFEVISKWKAGLKDDMDAR